VLYVHRLFRLLALLATVKEEGSEEGVDRNWRGFVYFSCLGSFAFATC
jgi:hypothetical protein